MGDITGRPKTPSPQVVYVPQYVYTNPTTNSSSTTNNTSQTSATPEQEQAEQREKSLLSRPRSRVGTVLTGFRGILAPSETGGQRKTLLGE